jgi:thiol-disulfide isomerase/thioredoxin
MISCDKVTQNISIIYIMNKSTYVSKVSFCLVAMTSLAFSQEETFHLKWQSSGIHEKDRGFRPHSLLLKKESPEGIKGMPKDLASPLYGELQLGPPDALASFLVIVDAPDNKPKRLFIDGNSNKDFSDDPACTWEDKTYKLRDGGDGLVWNADGMVKIPFSEGKRDGQLKFYFDKSRVMPPVNGGVLRMSYFSDYGLAGDVKIDGQVIPVMLEDAGCRGHFKISQEVMINPLLWLGIPNPRTGAVGVVVPAQKPFEVAGKWWALTNMTLDGAFQIKATEKPVMPTAPKEVDLSPGVKAPAFTGKQLTGKNIEFPGDYKGKIVLIDFWATWCGPCVAEIPNVIKAYEAYHEKGLEVLGVSLDKEDMSASLKTFTTKRKMPWPQVYDGKFWQADVAKLYGIRSIPHMLLVDGDTGEVIVNKAIRGEALLPAIEKALEAKKK